MRACVFVGTRVCESTRVCECMHSQWRTSASYRDSTGLADARIDVRAFSEQMMPAFATEIVCCSITCGGSDRMLHGTQARVAPCGWHGRNHMRSHAVLCCAVDSLARTGAWQVLHVFACRSTPRVRSYTATWSLHVACSTIYISLAAVRHAPHCTSWRIERVWSDILSNSSMQHTPRSEST